MPFPIKVCAVCSEDFELKPTSRFHQSLPGVQYRDH
jgi:hypothetical protein